MQQRSFIFVAALRGGPDLAGAVAVYAYDSSNEDQIADGVTVAGVDVGGLTPTRPAQMVSARAGRAARAAGGGLRHGAKRFTLSAEDAELKADVGGMVDAASSQSRDGN